MLFKIYNVIKRKINIIFYIVVIAALLIVTGTFTYSRYTYHYETTVSVTVPSSSKCSSLGVNKLGECVILTNGATTDYTVDDAKKTIESKTYDTTTIEPITVTTSEGVLSSTSDSSPGLYSTTDYKGGNTYFFRGEVTNNYVSYAGYIWRIIRINEDGSIRMIYSGTSTSDTGSDTSIGTSAFNSKYNDIFRN